MKNTKLLFYPSAAFLGITIFTIGVFFGIPKQTAVAQTTVTEAQPSVVVVQVEVETKEQKPEEPGQAVIDIDQNINSITLGFGGSNVVLDKETKCLALNIYHEAKGEPIMGQLAVGFVTLNRVGHEDFETTICKVVYQPGQFSWVANKPGTPKEKEAWNTAVQIAHSLVKKKATNDITDGATYFHANYVSPGWGKRFTKTAVVGKHVFYRKDVA